MILQKINQVMSPYWPIIHKHHFNQLLSNGTLPMPIFCNFLKHDKVFYFKFAQCLNHVAKRTTYSKHREILLYLSHEAFKTHKKLHDKYLMMDSRLISFFPNNPVINTGHGAINNYMKHLHHTTHSESIPIVVAIASLIPCFYIYSNLGLKMQQKSVGLKNLYQLWIDSYSNPTFLLSTQLILSVLDELTIPEIEIIYQPLIIEALLTSVSCEIAFWDSVLSKQPALFQAHTLAKPCSFIDSPIFKYTLRT